MKLTKRESQILELLKQGFSNKEIAQELHIKESTVKNHLNSIYRIIGAKNRTHAIFLYNKI